MPKYKFVCSACGENFTKYVAHTVEFVGCINCNNNVKREFPKIDGPTEVKELIDPYLNKRLNKDHEQIKEQRRELHYWEVEVPRLVDTYSLETCLEQGWLKYNDKGELVINKPPSKR
jgi:copper chaperone CopZ